MIHVGYGDNRIKFNVTNRLGADFPPKEIHVHPKYDKVTPYYDVAIISTDLLILNSSLLPVCLPKFPDPDPDSYKNFAMSLIGECWMKNFIIELY